MNVAILAGLLLGAPQPEAHHVEIDHQGQRVDVTYQSATDVIHKQVGAVGAAGRGSTLRCVWRANISVAREARSTAGHVLARTIAGDAPVEGSRPGWCSAQRGAIAQDIAARSADTRAHLLAVAERDREVLALELDTAHAAGRS